MLLTSNPSRPSSVGQVIAGGASLSRVPGASGRAKLAFSAGPIPRSNSLSRSCSQYSGVSAVGGCPPGYVNAVPTTRTWVHDTLKYHAMDAAGLLSSCVALGMRRSVVARNKPEGETVIDVSYVLYCASGEASRLGYEPHSHPRCITCRTLGALSSTVANAYTVCEPSPQ